MSEKKFDKKTFGSMKADLEGLVSEAESAEETMQKVSKYLYDEVPHYNWVGFYMAREDGMLDLGPYVGEPTEHVKIAFGSGICGQAAETKNVFVVQDVTKETNYLSCSPDVKSEIVVPLIKNGEIAGELDIDSHSLSPFEDSDREFLEWVCDMVSGRLED